MKSLYVGNISYKATRDGLIDLFSRCGDVMGVALPFDYQTKQHKGFAFVEFENPKDAEWAVQSMNNMVYLGRELVVRLIDKKIVER